jgi:hypothetical protein
VGQPAHALHHEHGTRRRDGYVTRPPIAKGRLERLADGSLEPRLKHPWKDGTCTVVLEPDDLLVRLVAAVPPPRFHLLRYFGVLSSHSRLRRQVVPHPPADPNASAPPPAPGDQLELALHAHADAEPPTRKAWAWLLRHAFKADLDTCPRCSGPMRWVEAAARREAACDLLARLGLHHDRRHHPAAGRSGSLSCSSGADRTRSRGERARVGCSAGPRGPGRREA